MEFRKDLVTYTITEIALRVGFKVDVSHMKNGG